MLGLVRMVSAKKDAIGTVMSRREGLVGDARVLVGLQPVHETDPVVAGSHLFADGAVVIDRRLGADERSSLHWGALAAGAGAAAAGPFLVFRSTTWGATLSPGLMR